jgi:hypothetical protein
MSYRKGIIPAYKLRKQSKGDGFIEDYVNDNLGLIEDDIIQANERKELYSVTEIPTNYDIPYMDNARAQKHIYFHTMKALKAAEYKPRLQLEGNDHRQKAYIHIKWITKDDVDQEKYMDEFLTAHSVKPKAPDRAIIMTSNPTIQQAINSTGMNERAMKNNGNGNGNGNGNINEYTYRSGSGYSEGERRRRRRK